MPCPGLIRWSEGLAGRDLCATFTNLISLKCLRASVVYTDGMKKLFWILPLFLVLLGAGYYFYSRKHATEAMAALPQKLFLIGLDGASWNLMNPLLKQGKLPNFQKLIDGGTFGPLKSFTPTKSPILWTSIATGKIPAKHGIGSFTAEKDGKMIPVSGVQRVTKAFWNILSEYGITVGIVNWWVTWPPEQLNGFVVSDRYRESSAKKLRGKMVFTYPETLFKELPRVRLSKKEYMEDRRQIGLPEELRPKAQSAAIEALASGYKGYWSQDKAIRKTCNILLDKNNVQVFAVVFRIIDVSSHLFWTYLDLELIDELRKKYEKEGLNQQDIDRIDTEFVKIVGPIYIYADQILGDFLKHADSGTDIIICSDHGFKFDEGRYGHSYMDEPPDGILILNGPSFRRKHTLRGATLLDITPTLLYTLKIPVGRDMDGKILFEAFRSDFVKSYPPKMTASHDRGFHQEGEAVSSEVDEEMLEDLKSLGYIQ